MAIINRNLVEIIRARFPLDWHGIHGAPHWARVRVNGLKLAQITGANSKVIEYFSFLHDSCRMNDGSDPDHGPRAASFAEDIWSDYLHLNDHEFELLHVACSGHTAGKLKADMTVMTCWDADRLDLGRVSIRPDSRRLCTDAAKNPETIEWAIARSLTHHRLFGQNFEEPRHRSSQSR